MNWSSIGTVVVVLAIGAKFLHTGSLATKANRAVEYRNQRCESMQSLLNQKLSTIETDERKIDEWSRALEEKKASLETRIDSSFSMSLVEREKLIADAETFEMEIMEFNKAAKSLSTSAEAYNLEIDGFNSACTSKKGL